MTRYRFKHWEDPQLINSERTITLTEDKEILAIYEEVEMRKGLPSESNIVTVTVHPKPEITVLTLESDKAEYSSGDPIVLMGSLKFESDNTPLADRILDIYKNAEKINSATTDAHGIFRISDIAEDVVADVTLKYKAKFFGD